MEISVRMLNEKLTGYLQRANSGEVVVITRHGTAYAEIGPPRGRSHGQLDRLAALAERARSVPGVTWSGKSLSGASKPVALKGKGPTIAQMIVEGRG